MPANTHKKANSTTNSPTPLPRQKSRVSHKLRRVVSVHEEISFVNHDGNEDITDADDEDMQLRCFYEDSYSLSDEDSLYESDNECHMPFWYSFEEPSHIERVIKEYSRFLRLNNLSGSRQLPTFVGRIERHPVDDITDTYFTTLDVVVVYRRDHRQVGSTVSNVDDIVMVTKWDDDGVPTKFLMLSTSQEKRIWEDRKILHAESSFLYCLPVWRSSIEYVYQSCPKKKEVGYANEPFNFTKFLPDHYLHKLAEPPD